MVRVSGSSSLLTFSSVGVTLGVTSTPGEVASDCYSYPVTSPRPSLLSDTAALIIHRRGSDRCRVQTAVFTSLVHLPPLLRTLGRRDLMPCNRVRCFPVDQGPYHRDRVPP